MNFKYDIEYFDTNIASEKWGLSSRTVAKYCRSNLIPKAYKDTKSKIWRIPVNSIKPLNKSELKELLFLISKIHNYLSLDKDYMIKELESLDDISPALNYLENFGFVQFKDNVNRVTHVMITEKGYSTMNEGKTISIEVSSIIDLISSILRLVSVLGAHNVII